MEEKFYGNVLVAEDDLVNQKTIRALLEKAGLSVELVSDGQDAVRRASDTSYDLIFMDIQMPKMNGYDAVRNIRERGIDVPVVALSAHAMKRDIQKSLGCGCNDYLVKPVDRNKLMETLKRYLNDGGGVVTEADIDSVAAEMHDLAEQIKMVDRRRETENEKASLGDVSDVLDWDGLMERIGDPELIINIVESFFEDNPRRIELLPDALQSGNVNQVRSLSHAVKGAAATIGAAGLSKAASELEECAKHNRLSEGQQFMDRIRKEYLKLEVMVSQEDWASRLTIDE